MVSVNSGPTAVRSTPVHPPPFHIQGSTRRRPEVVPAGGAEIQRAAQPAAFRRARSHHAGRTASGAARKAWGTLTSPRRALREAKLGYWIAAKDQLVLQLLAAAAAAAGWRA